MDQNLQEVLMPISIIGSLGYSVWAFTRVMTDYILRKKMIDKGFVNDSTQSIFKSQNGNEDRYPSLKWGLIVLAAGLALITISLIDIHPDSPLPYGILAVFVSIGFLAYYFITQQKSNNQ